MSRLRVVSGKRIEDLLAAAPGALEADTAMRRLLVEQLTPRLYSLVGVVVAGCLRCERFVEDLRGPLDPSFAARAASDWRALALTDSEKAALTYTEKGTVDEASVRKRDVDELRAAGFCDKDVLLIATAIAYHNYAIRMAAAFDVLPR
ncbi:MAG: alkylhydroperoxidase [Deltaproteobacteria bacterium]|nr:alkylhydroperoxidase [Deltaproteobacteria bacterium]